MTVKLIKAINWKLALFTGLMLPVLLSLGFWQLRREDEKRSLQAVYESRQHAQALTLASLQGLTPEELGFLPVELSGRFDNSHHFLLDNRTHEGQQGVEVISPFLVNEGSTVLVNRGWLPRGAYRTDVPEVVEVEGVVTLTGNIYVPEGRPFTLGEEEPFSGWPRVLQTLDIARMYSELDVDESTQGLHYTLRLQDNMPGVFGRYWQPINMTPEKHRGYAVQWFAMATMLLLLFIYTVIKTFLEQRSTHHE